MKLTSIFAVYRESFGEKELEKIFSSYDKTRDYIIAKKEWIGLMILIDLDVEEK